MLPGLIRSAKSSGGPENVLAVSRRAEALYTQHRGMILRRTDRLFARLMAVQWAAAIATAIFVSPQAWEGTTRSVHLHVWMAFALGGVISLVPICLAVLRPGEALTRHCIAVGQMLMSALLIHLSGGRIETHFHVFGSLALLAFYRDWKVLVPATAVVAVDHLVRGVFFPQSVFGVAWASPWRALEHAAWVGFEDFFLAASCIRGASEMQRIALRTAELEVSEERFRSLNAASPVGIVETDNSGGCVYANTAWQEASGLSLEQSLGGGWIERFHPEDREQFLADWVLAEAAGATQTREYRLLLANGTIRWVSACSRSLRAARNGVTGYVGTVVDVSERKETMEALRHGAYHDVLTGLPNRTAFFELVSGALARQQRRREYLSAVLFLDLDRFKIINDSLGHFAGDQLLVTTAERLKSCLRPGDVVARLGGDEFILFLDDLANPADATRVAERIVAAVGEPFQLGQDKVFVSASIGIALSSAESCGPEELLRDADTAMYRAKARGSGGYEIFDQEMRSRAIGRLRVETDLRRALDRGEFFLCYQPVVSLATQEILGFEALVRWRQPDGTIVPPGEFIPVAEETGLILPLGAFVLREACCWMAGLGSDQPATEHLTISVNLSGEQLKSRGLVQQVAAVLNETGVPPGKLRLEVTESVMMQNAESAAAILVELRSLGVQIFLDDFGTGYSSLAYLQRFSFDALKIDRSFVSGLPAEGEGIVRAILALAQSLNLRVVAEGIETQDQWDHLTRLGCEWGQGYFFARPLEGGAAGELVCIAPIAPDRA